MLDSWFNMFRLKLIQIMIYEILYYILEVSIVNKL